MTAPRRSALPDLSTLLPVRAWWRDPALRAWPVWVFVALVAVPPFAIVALLQDEKDDLAVGTFAFYFAAAWFLLLRVAVRPRNLTGAMYAEIVAVALLTQVPLALALEGALTPDFGNLASSIFAVGLPEELAKALPVVALALLHRHRWNALRPQDYLFLGAVSGLAFGAQEAIQHYAVFYSGDLTQSDALQLVWRLATGPVSHAVWAGVAGYFVGLAVRQRDPRVWAALAGLGIALPATLHGLNNWEPVNGTLLWVALKVLSALLFLAYATVGTAGALPLTPPTPPTVPPATAAHHVPPTRVADRARPTPTAPGWRRGPDGGWTRA